MRKDGGERNRLGGSGCLVMDLSYYGEEGRRIPGKRKWGRSGDSYQPGEDPQEHTVVGRMLGCMTQKLSGKRRAVNRGA